MFEYGFVEGQDFLPILEKNTLGRPSTDYALTIDCAKEIAMLQRFVAHGVTCAPFFVLKIQRIVCVQF